MRPHVLILYQHYRSPDCPANVRVRSLLEVLRPHARLTLITSDAWRRSRQTDRFAWFPDGVHAIEHAVPYANRMSTPQRIRSYAAFAWAALRKSLSLDDPPDLVYGISTPLSTAAIAALVARVYRVPWIFELHDLWPSFPIQMGAVPFPWLERLLYRGERALYRSAAHVVTMSPDMTAHVESTGCPPDRVTTVLPGSDRSYLHSDAAPSPAHLRRQYNLPDGPVVLYAGTFGRANDIPTLIDVADRLQSENATFVFAGRGFFAPDLERLARRNDAVVLVPPQPLHHMGSWYTLADVTLVPFIDRPVLATNSPAKFFDSLTMGTPVVVTNPGWTRTFVETHSCGWYVPPSRPAALASRLRSLLATPDVVRAAGERGRATARVRFNRRQQYEAIPHLVGRCLAQAAFSVATTH